MKNRKTSILALVFALVLVFGVIMIYHTFSGDPSGLNPTYSKVVGAYDVSRLGTDFGGAEAYVIGANSKGMPIFKDTEKALQQALIDYKDGFKAVQEENHLSPASKTNWKKYKLYGWQLTTQNQSVLLQGNRISQFFDIYENSFGEK